jgi:hypothetical protein
MAEMAQTPDCALPTDQNEPAITVCVAALRERFGESLDAIILYGSFLRGKRDTVLDFYVLLRDYKALGNVIAHYGNQLLPPNVYFMVAGSREENHAAKFATMTLKGLHNATANDINSYFWSRFAQPHLIVFARDSTLVDQVSTISNIASLRLLSLTVPMLGEQFTVTAAWERAFQLTYGCELRSEQADRAGELVNRYHAHLHATFTKLATELPIRSTIDGQWRNLTTRQQRRTAALMWLVRRMLGKSLSVARLFKAAFTFADPLNYVLWKIERHSGLHFEATLLQRQHPLLFSWPLLWRIYRRGGFR